MDDLSKPLCGASRPGHFAGVTTIVTKLFHITMPDVAVFGQKDFQQLTIIRRMVRDLDFDIEIVGVPIVRENDGLALSSRNQYLSSAERTQATCLYRGLRAARSAFLCGERSGRTLERIASATVREAADAHIDYIELRDADTLERIEAVVRPAVLALAVHFRTTRLIDNVTFADD